ncbi:MAG TPA: hypothetical protein VFG59_12975 [Anaeromyxobacter sp.]|nr:hypothetical protein [Anaeromyxobacter sp.]
MPYGDTYSWVPPDGYGEPYAYVYYPDYGWTWVVAPWVWGIGPWPFFGVLGPVRFGWYVHGWWHTPWRWHYRPYWGVGGYGGRGYWRGGSRPIAPAPNRPVPGFGRGSVHSFGARSVPRLEIGHGTARAPMHFGR